MGGFSSQRARNVENVFIWWRHHVAIHPQVFRPTRSAWLLSNTNQVKSYEKCCDSICWQAIIWRGLNLDIAHTCNSIYDYTIKFLVMALLGPLSSNIDHNPGTRKNTNFLRNDYHVDAPTGDAPTTSEWSTSLLPTMVCFILESWR